MTTSWTNALELAAVPISAGPGDEVILPSFNSVPRANALVLRGAKLVAFNMRGGTAELGFSRSASVKGVPCTAGYSRLSPLKLGGFAGKDRQSPGRRPETVSWTGCIQVVNLTGTDPLQARPW